MTDQPTPDNGNRRGRSLGCNILIGAAILFAILIAIGLLFGGNAPTDAPQPAAVPPTATSVATQIPPTATPAPPTNAPMDTPTPEPPPPDTPTLAPPTDTPQPPTATPETPAADLAVAQYGFDVSIQMDYLANALDEIYNLMSAADTFTDPWMVEVATQLAIIQVVHEDLTLMNVPPEVADIHAAMLDATADCELATHYFAEGIDNLDTDSVVRAGELMDSCGTKMQIPIQMVNERTQ